MQEQNNPLIAFIIPALNEERDIQAVVRKTLTNYDRLGISGEVIVVNDGSTDNTPNLIKELSAKDSRVKLVNHQVRQGIGAAFWDGVDASMADMITWTSADNEGDPYENLRYHHLMSDVDIIEPFIMNKEVRPKTRRAISWFYRFIINTTFFTTFNYTNGAFMIRRSLLKALPHRCRGFFFHTDILLRLVKQGYLFAEVPIMAGKREGSKSKSISFKSLCSVSSDYLRLVRDIYFAGKQKTEFNPDSVTFRRRGE